MSESITLHELLRNAFVPPEERERLRRYLKARQDFLGVFGAGGDSSEEMQHRFAEAREILSHLEDRLRTRSDFLIGHVLPLVAELLQNDRERLSKLESQVHRLADAVATGMGGGHLHEVFERFEIALRVFEELERALIEVREDLTAP